MSEIWPLSWFLVFRFRNQMMITLFSSTLKVWEKKVVLFFHLEVKWPSYGHFHVSQQTASETKNQKSRKWPYLAHFNSKWKNKTTLFPSTLKVGEKKVVLFFHFELKWPSYGHFYVSQHCISEMKNQKSRKWPYLAHFSFKWKNKTTLYPSTLKVGEKKVVLFFHLELKWARYGYFLVFRFRSHMLRNIKMAITQSF